MMKPSSRVGIFWSLAIVLIGIDSPALLAQQADRDLLEAIDVAGRRQAHEIQSARVVFKYRNGGAREQLSGPKVDAAIEKLRRAMEIEDLPSSRKAFQKVVEELTGGDQWSEVLLVQQGESIRNRRTFPQSEISNDFATHADHRTYYWNENGLQQAEIESKDQPAKRVIKSLTFLRPVFADPGDRWKVIPANSTGTVTIGRTEKLPLFFSFDTQSNVMTQWVIGTPATNYMVRGGLTTYPGEIVMPTYGFNITVLDDKVRTFEAFLIEKAEYNIQLGDQEVHLQVPEKTRMIDSRDPQKKLYFHAPREDDALTLADENLAKRKAK
ncbi:hypothetical protein DTL21_04425 [Bremerella cremea]|uniref:Uncharacterized protein n=1 Tax=Blastopirellula marina TaxID=124 RepID=A0A2S8FYD2_9BACT|nr:MULTISPECIES: hypothetical protein [Pirellulaceae]PQO37199.1 hypothetical protein C5Y83_04425 [Blastopirellula marina]RCS49586.1 hypothetical protein DTL21_04425 [Bremerella cremea]